MAIIKIKNQAIDLDAAEIPNLPASKITSGTFTDARIADLAAAKLTGTIATARLGSGTASSATFLAGDSSYKEVSGGIDWQSSIVTGTTLTAVAGNGYWINTTSNACTITLPSNPTLGDEIVFVDYARKWGTNAITINQNSKNFQGNTSPNPVYNSNGQSVSIVYSDATQGWIPTVDDDVTLETPQNYTADFLVIGGGAGGGYNYGGGGGAGGYRNSFNSEASGGGGSSESSITIDGGTTYTITVGNGGAGGGNPGTDGQSSSIAGSGLTTITSLGGGAGGSNNQVGNAGGSGGGAGAATNASGGAGTSNQGYAGGTSTNGGGNGGGGGGGASAVGANPYQPNGGNGGNGLASSITGSSVTRTGGGGGGDYNATAGTGGSGGGGNGGTQSSTERTNGTANTGSGGGGGGGAGIGNGGSGVVILRMPDANYSGTVSGSPTVATGVSGNTVLTFTGSGSYTG